jgi:hypothetical protein
VSYVQFMAESNVIEYAESHYSVDISFSPQNPQTVHGIGEGVPFFWCSAVVLGKNVPPLQF